MNDQLVASTGDYVLQPGNKGQNTVIKEGCFGILNWNSKVTFQNTYYKELSGDFNPLLTDISVTSSVGTVEEKTQFTPTEPITLQYVKNNASTVNIQVTRASNDAVVEVKDANGVAYADGKNIPVKEGSNYITVTSTVTAEDGTTATMTYRVNVHRFKADGVYYNEAYRDQYHYSVKEGWANDPNGLVYFNGTYHMFYQFYDDIRWGPMHWAHATSTDLIHWEEEPIALYPDANGAMYSGCIVVDEHNTSGFFDGIPGGGLVALITADGNGERIKLAYSRDEGKTWTKVDQIAADWTNDPLNDAAFRDPKVFRWEGKWFMVVAGGPLRIYSSDNLRNWTCEATYADLHTECPDLYPIEAPDGQIKWVLSRGGRFYKVGDFKTVDGKWRFVPDAEYENSDGVMNFGRDFYAAMTYYVQDFGTASNPTLPELVELNWMNTWDDYCNQVAEKVDQDFNGTFNLNLKLGLVKDGAKYVLTQTPISGYETLRQTDKKQEWTQVTVEENNALLKDFVGDTYEIIAKFYPEADTRKVGFKVRTGEGEETLIVYDLEAQSLSIDRSSSGVIISSKFAQADAQNVTANADGTVDLHIYVDKASVEVFTKDYTAAGAAQIFPSPLSVGAEVLVEGAAAKADITIYPLSSIWTNKAEVTEPQHIGTTSATSQNLYVGDTLKLTAYVLPTNVSQEITWSVKDGSDVVEVDASGTVTALKKGTGVVVAASKANPSLTKEFAIRVTENHFKTNIPEFVNVSGNWSIDDETLSVSNGGQNDYYMSAEAIEGNFVLETDICYTRGLINLFLASEHMDPHVGAGAYTIQFGSDTNVRLFPFGKDDFATGTLGSSINDGVYHHVKVIKDGRTIQVYVDAVKCLEHTFEQTEAFFANGYVGIGLWDGALDVQNFFVYTHSYNEPVFTWSEDNTCTATFACVDGDDTQILACEVTSETTPATEDEAGETVYTATVIFNGKTYTDTKTVEIPAIGHVTHKTTLVPAVEASCEHTGNIAYYTCSGCDLWFEDAEATQVIDDHNSVTVPLADHRYESVVTAPTCTEQGYTTHRCSVCGDSYVDTYVDAAGHSYENGTCTECGETDPDYEAPTEPSEPEKPGKPGWGSIWDRIWGSWWDDDKCEHEYTSVVVAPTCEQKGYTTHTCKKCGDSYKDSNTAALGHQYEDGACTVCGEKEPTKPESSGKPGWGSIWDKIFGRWH